MGLKIDIEGYKIGPNKESIPIKKVIELEKWQNLKRVFR
jgi:hypothetical protein